MANYCYSTYRITGEASELDALYELMSRLEKEKEMVTGSDISLKPSTRKSPNIYM